MGTISDKLVFLGETKNQIRNSIIAKGVSVPTNTTFRDYATKIGEIPPGLKAGWSEAYWQDIYDNSYTRPADWLDIITPHPLVQGSQKFVGLHAIFDNESNFCALSATTSTGDYRVDWGDGTTSDHNSGTIAYKNFSFSDFPGTDSVRGYRQAIVTVIPLTGNLTNINLQRKHNQTGLTNNYLGGWLDIRIAGNFITSLNIGQPFVRMGLLEQFDFVGTNVITGSDGILQNCYNLQRVVNFDVSNFTSIFRLFHSCYSLRTIPQLNTSSKLVSMEGVFNNCYSLITIPLLDTVNVTDLIGTFLGCSSLQLIPPLNTGKVTNMTSTFFNCYSLVAIPPLNTEKVTTFQNAFFGCNSLIKIPPLDTSSAINMNQMFSSCLSLTTIPLLNTTNVTNMSGMFSNCLSLKEIPLMNTTNVTNINSMFATNNSLRQIQPFDFRKVTSLTSAFQNCSSLRTIDNIQLNDTTDATSFASFVSGCPSLASVKIDGIKNTISFQDCYLGKDALVDIFTRLTTQSGKTITITGNWGASLLTTQDREIATNKGWTIIG
jgi:hypothetical protein